MLILDVSGMYLGVEGADWRTAIDRERGEVEGVGEEGGEGGGREVPTTQRRVVLGLRRMTEQSWYGLF